MLSSVRIYISTLLFGLLPETRCYGFKRSLLRFAGAKIGKNVRICSSAHIIGSGKLEIGDNTFIGPLTFIHVSSSIKIGRDCDISSKVTILNGTHQIDYEGTSIAGKGYSEDVVIGDGCWVCTGATILGSSRIGNRCLIAANSTTKGEYLPKMLLKGTIAKQIELKPEK